jgi:hypothetical protein
MRALGPAEVRTLPGAFGDPFRALDVAPGVTPVLSGFPYFYVRGAPPANVGYFLDGVRVPYLFHFGLGPGVIHPELVASTELYKGGYPAAFGRYAGGIVSGTTTPPRDRVRGSALVRAFDAGALAEAPFADGKGSALVAGRYSYTAALFSLLQSDTELDYRDYQARVSYALTPRDTVSMLAFGAYDLAAERGDRAPVPGGRRVLFASEFHRADFRWDRRLAGGGRTRVAATVGLDRTRVEARRFASDAVTGVRAELEQPLSDVATLRAGADLWIDAYASDPLERFADDDDVVARQQKVFATRVDFTTGARADVVLRPTRELEVVPGVRADVYGSAGEHAFAVDPRLAGRLAVTKGLRIVHAYGLASQPPSSPVALPAVSIARLEGGLQRAFQTSAGVEVDLPHDFTAGAGVFHNAFWSMNDALGSSQRELLEIERNRELFDKSQGSALGLELEVRRKLSKRVTGLASYTLSRSTRALNGRRFLAAFDRPHVVNAVLSVDLGRGFRAGARVVAYSGVPVSTVAPRFAEERIATPPSRTPTFVRLDVRLEKRWRIGQTGYISVVAEGLNATLSREVTGYLCAPVLARAGSAVTPPACVADAVGPIAVPSLGVSGGF